MSETTANPSIEEKANSEAPLVQGSIWRSIWIMSWPLLLTTVSNSLVGLVDVKVAMKLGSASQASVGLAEHIVFMFLIFLMSAAVGTTAVVSRAFGAKEHDSAIRGVSQSIVLSLAMGVALTLICFAVSGTLLNLFTPSPEVLCLATSYLAIYTFILIPFSLICIISASFRAAGNAKTPLLIVGTMTVVNIMGDFLTIYGNWPVPNLGVRGIAFAGLTADCVGAILGLFCLKFSNLKDSLDQFLPFHPETIMRVFKIGMPSAFQRLGWAFSFFVVMFILKLCANPTAAIASVAIGTRVEALLFMPLLAFSLAISSIVGQNLGAKQYDRAFKAGWQITWVGIILMVVLSTGMFLMAGALAATMSQDPDTIGYVTSYLRTNALSEPMLALGMILGGALQGAGDTRTPMWITLITQWTVRLPLAWFLALYFGLGPQGAWTAMAISVYCMGLLVAARYQSKGWIKIKV
jgi:putative MATE family efflux protein